MPSPRGRGRQRGSCRAVMARLIARGRGLAAGFRAWESLRRPASIVRKQKVTALSGLVVGLGGYYRGTDR